MKFYDYFFFSYKLEFMDALTAPRAHRKTEITSTARLRGLGMEEGDSRFFGDSSQSRQHEAAKPRGMYS